LIQKNHHSFLLADNIIHSIFSVMKITTLTLATLALVATEVVAFPAIGKDALKTLEVMAKDEELKKRDIPRVLLEKEARKKRSVGFNAAEQFVSVSGANKFVPPNFAAGDQRGPCPALNALANHNYLPHNGVGTLTD
jgi:Peroxidase, family 2